ncbi:MAG: acyltransferase family protein [Pseudomonadota bacterium]|jgi:peptidoglycan/LPS O-acetylase OafA/YrhL
MEADPRISGRALGPVPAAPARNARLDGLRGYAAFVVAIYHTIIGMDISLADRIVPATVQSLQNGYDRALKIALLIVSGETAVVIFFVLSGVVLFKSLAADRAPFPTLSFHFVVRRIFRIYPALLACLMASALVLPWAGVAGFDLRRLAENALLLDFKINGATWTLAVEFLAIPLFLAAILAYRRFGEWGLLGLVLLIWLAMLKPVKTDVLQLQLMQVHWFAFALGMLIPTRIGERVVQVFPLIMLPVFFICMLLARHVIEGPNTSTRLLQWSAALLVLMLYHGTSGGFGRFLERPVSQFLGRISYSFYLFNVMFLEIVCHHLRGQPWAAARPLEAGLLASVAVIALTLPVAYLSARYIEEPAIRAGRALLGRRKSGSGASKETAPAHEPVS